MIWIFPKLGGITLNIGAVLDMIADVLKTIFEELGKDVGIYMELDGKNVVLIKLVDAMDWVNDGNTILGCTGNSRMNGFVDELAVDWGYDEYMILGCKGNLGINFSVDEVAVKYKNEVTAYRVEFFAGIIVVCNWETGGLM